MRLLIAALAIWASYSSPASAESWQNTILAVEKRSEHLWALARKRGFPGHLGTLYNELHSSEHSCSILGRMLGMTDLIGQVEISTEVGTELADDHTTAMAAQSLDNWVHQARRHLKQSPNERAIEWNLDCVGNFGIPKNAFVEQGTETFYRVDDRFLLILGDVEPGFSDKVIDAIRKNPQVTTVALGSGGGSVYEAIRAGRYIRAAGLNTQLWSNCYSACTIVFIGGVDRWIMSPYPSLSFHQVSIAGRRVPNNDAAYTDIARYARDMGVDPELFLRLMWSASPRDFTTPQPRQLCNSTITTWIQRIC